MGGSSPAFHPSNEHEHSSVVWLRFIARHRTELAQGQKFQPGDGSGLDELLSPGWQFYAAKE